MSTITTVFPVDENYNDINNGGKFSLRKTLALIGGVVLVATVGFVGVVTYGTGRTTGFDNSENIKQIPVSSPLLLEKSIPAAADRTVPKTSLVTVEQIRLLARELGSHPPSNLDVLEKQGDICYTQGCLDAAFNLLNSINFTINPCDDFYQFTCGRWLTKNEIPPAASRWSQFNFLRDEVNNVTQSILTSPKDNNDAKPISQVKDLYKGCIDTDALESTGLSPIRNILKDFGDWPLLIPDTWEEEKFNLLTTIGNIRRRFLDTPILTIYVDQDLKSADKNIIYIDQPSLVIPRDMLINEGDRYKNQIAAYKQFVTDLANELAAADSNTLDPVNLELSVNAILEFETEIAKITTRDEERSNYTRMYNKYNLSEYQETIDPSLSIKILLDTVFNSSGVVVQENEPIIVLEKEFVTNLIQLLIRTPKQTISNYLGFRIISGLGGETTKNMRDHAFKFTSVLTGATEPPTREKTCADAANNGLGMAIGVKYIEQKFDQAAKTEVDQLVEDLRVAFKQILTGITWMDPTTRGKAQEKADKMRSFMAYPDWLSDKVEVEKYFGGLDIVENNHSLNVEKLGQWSGDKTLNTLREPVDRDMWLTYPGVVNAFYAPTFNSITFPAGILQAPFFKSGYPSFLNYGGIGVVIGHEITHGFDNSGRQFDAIGNAENWWSDETSKNYDVNAKCIEDQYSTYKVEVEGVDMNVNGLLTLGENIADNGGLREAYIAYKKFVEDNGVEKRLPGLEQFEPEQLFFMGYANIWCENITPAGLRNQILTDPHSPARFRVKGPLSNNEDFSTKWNCPPGSGMNPKPEDRCILW